jgi:hypothetical protein
MLQVHVRAADVRINNKILIVEDHTLICKYVPYDLV